jgi:hypothetical protein
MNLDEQWEQFVEDETYLQESPSIIYKNEEAPECSELYISTKTKVLFLNQELDLNNIFWKIPVYEYHTKNDCIIKKQMKIVSNTVEEYNDYKEKIKDIKYYKENIIKQIDNPTARRIKFKDERKITIGISNKDIINYRGKAKNAFYNCFALIIRFNYFGEYKEMHVKVFNTGKLEIPGVVNNNILDIIKKLVIDNLQPYLNDTIMFRQECPDENVLINSNFNCGYYINRDKLQDILKHNYNLETAFDPCSYPGVKCKYYYNNDLKNTEQTGKIDKTDNDLKMSDLNDTIKYTSISIMIFRTGSCLIVGNCNETILLFVFNFIKNILKNEYINIRAPSEKETEKNKSTKLKKRKIILSKSYYNKLTS